ncbi:MAG: glycosyltransferase [bacterium]
MPGFDLDNSYAIIVILWLSGFFILYTVGLIVSYIVFFLMGIMNLGRYRHYVNVVDLHALFKTSLTKPVSILVPAYNEERVIMESVRSLLTLHYPQFEVIVVNDGSADETMRVLIESFELVPVSKVYQRKIDTEPVKAIYESRSNPNLVVVDKPNGGKSSALNVGINVSQYPYFCTLDADSILDSDALLKTMRPFIEHPDTMIAVGGVIRVANNCVVDYGRVKEVNIAGNWLALAQTVEYLMTFLSSRIAFARMGVVLLISGAFGMFHKESVIEVGGYREDTIGEDMELVVRLNRILRKKGRRFRMFYNPDPVCWTEVPEDLKSLAGQRRRWQKGLVDSIRYNGEMLFNPRFGLLGMFGMPYYLIFEMLGCVVELFGYVMLIVFWLAGVLSLNWMLLWILMSMATGFMFTVLSVLVEELSFHRYRRVRDLFMLLWGGFLYNFGFRQINAVWRLQAMLEYLGGFRKLWGAIRRGGFRTAGS